MKPTCVIEQADCIDWLKRQPDDSADLVFTSPPYELARLYLEGGKNLGVARKTEEWVAWLLEVWRECQRVCKGLVAFVVAGQTKNYRWSAGPALLAADLHRAGFNLRNPPIFSRVGIPGSGGPDWLRGDYEWIICTSRPGQLPWSNNTACGHPPKWAPGGEISHRTADGTRVNGAFGFGGRAIRTRSGKGRIQVKEGECEVDGEIVKKRPSHVIVNGRDQWGGTPTETSGEGRKPNGESKAKKGRRVTSGHISGDTSSGDSYYPPMLANPGNIIHLNVGGSVMGSRLCHANEAPFPEELVRFFVRSFCRPGGTVIDPYSGSGTTAAVCVQEGRNFRGCDLRESQCELTRRRIGLETPTLFPE